MDTSTIGDFVKFYLISTLVLSESLANEPNNASQNKMWRIDLIFSPENDKTNSCSLAEGGDIKKSFDASIEYPVNFNEKGDPVEFDKTGIGYYCEIKLRRITDGVALLKCCVEYCELVGWQRFEINNAWQRFPQFKHIRFDGELDLFLGDWKEVFPSENMSNTLFKIRASIYDPPHD